MRRLGNLINILQPSYLFTRPVAIGVTAEFVVGQLTSPYSLRAPILLSVASYLLAVATTFLLLGAVFVATSRHVGEHVRRLIMLVVIPVAAAIGGGLMSWVRDVTGLDPEPLLALRILSTVVNVSAATILMWLAVSSVRLHYQRLAALEAERDRLEALRLQARQNLSSFNAEATELVRSRILQGLASLEMMDIQGVLAALTATIEQTVRPLSRQLEAQSAPWIPPSSQPRGSQRINWRAAVVEGTAPALLNPLVILSVLSLVALPMNVFRVGPVFAMQFVLLTFVIGLPIFLAVRWLFLRVAGRTQGIPRLVNFVVMCLLCGAGWGASTLVITAGTPQPLRFLWLCPIFTLAFAFIWGSAAAAQKQARATEEALQSTTDELRWRIARKRELHRQQQRALVHAVHGDVQAALAAGILQLEAALRAREPTDERVQEVRSRIVACVNELDLRKIRPSSLSVVATKVKATWAGAVELALEVEPGVEVALEEDPQCLMTLNDLLPELVFNSIKHGRATQVRVSLAFASEQTLLLSCEDDGVVVSGDAKAGLGTRLLDDCAVDWSRERRGGWTELGAILPILVPPDTAQTRAKADAWDAPWHEGTGFGEMGIDHGTAAATKGLPLHG